MHNTHLNLLEKRASTGSDHPVSKWTGMSKQAAWYDDLVKAVKYSYEKNSDVYNGIGSGLATYALTGLLPGAKKNRLARFLASLGIGAAGYKFGNNIKDWGARKWNGEGTEKGWKAYFGLGGGSKNPEPTEKDVRTAEQQEAERINALNVEVAQATDPNFSKVRTSPGRQPVDLKAQRNAQQVDQQWQDEAFKRMKRMETESETGSAAPEYMEEDPAIRNAQNAASGAPAYVPGAPRSRQDRFAVNR